MSAVLRAVSAILEEGLREGVAPALSAAVLRGGAIVHSSCHGELSFGRPLESADLFDVASLTKVMVTSTLAAQLVAEGTLSLEDPVAAKLAGFGARGKAAITVRQLLAHSSGLPSWRPYFELAMADPVAGRAFEAPGERPQPPLLRDAFARGREIVRSAVLSEEIEAPPGTRALYSDPGFLALGFLFEEALGTPLSVLADRRVFHPLGLSSTFFLDRLLPAESARREAGRSFVPTQLSEHRHEVNQGAVDDDNAWAMGGAAGHAGVFSTALDVATFGQAWLDALQGRDSIVPAPVAREMAGRDATPGSTRALGWDTPSREGSSLGKKLGRSVHGAIGHLGFTGASLWIDPGCEVVVALLTNRVHPSRENERIRQFRPRFHDAVAEALGVG